MIKQPWLMVVSGLIFIACLYFIFDRLIFLQSAERVNGSVESLSSSNGRCGGGRRRRSYPCTRFNARVRFTTSAGQPSAVQLSAGSARGHDVSTASASRRVGQAVPIVYDPKSPTRAYEDTTWGVWGVPIMSLIFQIVTFFMSFLEPKGRRFES